MVLKENNESDKEKKKSSESETNEKGTKWSVRTESSALS